jgi:hypothetical protein
MLAVLSQTCAARLLELGIVGATLEGGTGGGMWENSVDK